LTTAAAALAFVTLLPQLALAQGNPNANDILKGLKPGPTRGIRPVQPGGQALAPAPTPAPSAGTAPTAAATEAPSVSLNVEFATGSAELTPQAMRTLNELGKALTSAELAGDKFRIEGHTDTVGSRALNQSLSEKRADAVVNYLIAKFSIDRARLEAVGMGEEGLAVATPPQTPEPRNRRVQVINLGA
jgi:outer membrane protein OmpA-like peptidoglycan-associated protein